MHKKKQKAKFLNRELNWLEFNQRVLDQAFDPTIPLLERLKFLSISSSNLDQFFMVRVGRLKLLEQNQKTKLDPAGYSPYQQIDAINKRAHRMVEDQYHCFLFDLDPKLVKTGIKRVTSNMLNSQQLEYAQRYFDAEVMPIVTPMLIDPGLKIPLLTNGDIYLAVRVKPQGNGAPEARIVILPISKAISRFVTLPGTGAYEYLLCEDLVKLFLGKYFPKEIILECITFRITRNADLDIEEDLAPDLLHEMKGVILARKTGACLRLEISQSATLTIITFLKRILKVKPKDVYPISGPLALSEFTLLSGLQGYSDLKFQPWAPLRSIEIEPTESMFETLSDHDVLLLHPYESFDPVVRLITESANDPDVLSIKQTLYRTSANSSIAAALKKAAERGKNVTVIVELKARFDEEQNIEWAESLEHSGVQVIYGIKGFKTHAKLCIILRREAHGIIRYMHFGTGNYNESTAKLYSDISYLTCNEELGQDASSFFNTISGLSQPQPYRKLEASPTGMRSKILALVESEVERKKQGQQAHIMAKVNSLVDPQIIKALYQASIAGVKIDLNIRGTCCLQPGIPKLSENIRVISIVDRFLEHSRLFYFYHGGERLTFISSADWMPRNLDRRIELLIPVETPSLRDRLVSTLKTYFRDNTNAWELNLTGQYDRINSPKTKRGTCRSQEQLYRQVEGSIQEIQSSRPVAFEPHIALSERNL